MSDICIWKGAVAIEPAVVMIESYWGSTRGERCTLFGRRLLGRLLYVAVVGPLNKNGTHIFIINYKEILLYPLRTLSCDLNPEKK